MAGSKVRGGRLGVDVEALRVLARALTVRRRALGNRVEVLAAASGEAVGIARADDGNGEAVAKVCLVSIFLLVYTVSRDHFLLFCREIRHLHKADIDVANDTIALVHKGTFDERLVAHVVQTVV